MNVIVITGNLGQDPEVKQNNGKPFARFSVAVERDYKDSSGVKPVDWFHCDVHYDKTINYLTEYVKKGDKVEVSGSMRSNKNANTGVTYWGLRVDKVNKIGNAKEGGSVDRF